MSFNSKKMKLYFAFTHHLFICIVLFIGYQLPAQLYSRLNTGEASNIATDLAFFQFGFWFIFFSVFELLIFVNKKLSIPKLYLLALVSCSTALFLMSNGDKSLFGALWDNFLFDTFLLCTYYTYAFGKKIQFKKAVLFSYLSWGIYLLPTYLFYMPKFGFSAQSYFAGVITSGSTLVSIIWITHVFFVKKVIPNNDLNYPKYLMKLKKVYYDKL